MPQKGVPHHRARVASLSRSRSPEDPELIKARQDLAECSIAATVKRHLEAAPPLTDEQRQRLAGIFGGARR